MENKLNKYLVYFIQNKFILSYLDQVLHLYLSVFAPSIAFISAASFVHIHGYYILMLQ